MTTTVDASVVVKWFLNEEGADAARAVREVDSLVAPDFVLLELFHTLSRFARRKQFRVADVSKSIASATRTFDRLEPLGDLIEDAMTLSRAHDHAVYDCLYISLALRRNTRLATADTKQASAAKRAGVEVQLL